MDTLKDINKKLDKVLLALHDAGLGMPPCKYTLHAWLDEFLAVYKAPNVKPETLYTLDVAVRCHIKPNLADVPLDLVSGIELQKFLYSIQHSRTRETVRQVLFASFRMAAKLRLIREDPTLAVSIPRHKRKQGKALTDEELAAFMRGIAGHWAQAYFLFLIYTGCRRSEALALRPCDVDLENKRLHIPGTKTISSDRIIPLFDPVVGLLVQNMPENDGVFFPFRADSVTRVFHRKCPGHKLHDLRHTFATRCLEAGIPLKVVQMWLGHADFEVTANIYSHVTSKIDANAAACLNSFFATESKKDAH